MRLTHLSLFTAVLALLLLCSETQAQWGGRRSNRLGYGSYIYGDAVSTMRKKPFQRFSVGLTYVPVSATFSYRTVDENYEPDSMKSMDIKGSGFGVAYSMSIPVAHAGNNSLLAIGIGLNANWYLLKSENQFVIEVKEQNYTGKYSYTGSGGGGFMISVPVSLDLVSGGEATLDRSNPFSFTLGVGFIPFVSMGAMYEFVGAKASAPLYAKLELGFHAGINWKVRAAYLGKSPTSFSESRGDIFPQYGMVETNMKSNDQFMLSVLVQPFSFGWD
ncbi:MAG TPA: hypothetical protein PL009_09475 [Flavipsychrobacter sp.]|nr:hypothetical protein [Flavipsychrobacter sp.]